MQLPVKNSQNSIRVDPMVVLCACALTYLTTRVSFYFLSLHFAQRASGHCLLLNHNCPSNHSDLSSLFLCWPHPKQVSHSCSCPQLLHVHCSKHNNHISSPAAHLHVSLSRLSNSGDNRPCGLSVSSTEFTVDITKCRSSEGTKRTALP